jgi:predicted AlkP superfamily pyrophosphatase or phosphodiesterase
MARKRPYQSTVEVAMNNKVILIVLDGLNYQVARDCMGYLNGLIEHQRTTLYKIQSELPSMSRPLYECLLTGVSPVESGIVNNNIVRLSHHESVFSLARKQGLKTAAAAYHWVSELYNIAPYHAVRDRFTDDENLNIQHGCFYHWDHYPDEALFLDAEHLRRTHGGILPEEREVPLFVIGHRFSHQDPDLKNIKLKQTDICGSICQLLALEHDKPYSQELLAL